MFRYGRHDRLFPDARLALVPSLYILVVFGCPVYQFGIEDRHVCAIGAEDLLYTLSVELHERLPEYR